MEGFGGADGGIGSVATDGLFDSIEELVAGVFGLQGFGAEAVDFRSLSVHDIVIFEGAFAHHEVLLFDSALGGFDGAVEPGVFEDFALFDAEFFHDAGNFFGAK